MQKIENIYEPLKKNNGLGNCLRKIVKTRSIYIMKMIF